jgi:KUP system potassium uptake protein
MAALTLGALGVVFGDIGTSPLYALNAVFSTGVVPDQAGVYGVISLVFWSVTIVVSIKYVTFVMRADHEGEGGMMALIALVQGIASKRSGKAALIALGVFGAALFYGEGMITPAISVLSAIEGLEVAAPSLADLVVPITLVVLTLLFGIQRLGTGAVGWLFGPVMCLWFGVLAVSGLGKVLGDPSILTALTPSYAVAFFLANPGVAFLALGGVVLTVTGAEALYADLGHFGRPPIRRAWLLIVFPALTLHYMGQGALILESPSAIGRPFFLLMPAWAQIPAVLLATAATVIASQAVISAVFSVTRQAMQLGFVPRLNFRHTSGVKIGQVYSPAINGALFVAVVALVLGFGSSSNLAGAYGIAVTGTMISTTILFLAVVRWRWRKPVWVVAAGGLVFLAVELAFLGANLPKVVAGGWFPLAVGLALFGVLTTWHAGQRLLTPRREQQEGLLRDFIEEVRSMDPPIYRAPGTAVFLHARKETTPLALRENVDHNRVLHESVVIVSIDIVGRAHVPGAERLTVDDLGYGDDGISHVSARFGFRDEPNVPNALCLPAAETLERDIDFANVTYFLSQMTIVPTDAPGMSAWRKKLFVAISHAATSPADYFGLPDDRIVTIGSHIDL